MRYEDLIKAGFICQSNMMSETFRLVRPGLQIVIHIDNMTKFETISIEACTDDINKLEDKFMEIFTKIKDG